MTGVSFSTRDWLVVGLSFALTTLLTPLVRALARRCGVVAQPKSDRWHKRPTAMLGGVSIFVSVAAVVAVFGPRNDQVLMILAGGTFLFVVGLIDDFLQIKPYKKLAAQVMGAALVIQSGLLLPWTGVAPVDTAITLLWLVGVTNAINLLDNMDGLAAGIAAIAAIFLAVNFVLNGQTVEAVMLAAFAAGLLGFLIYNSNPASIFMGDSGSMFIGFFLAGSALLSLTGGRTRSFLPVIAVPALVLMIPIFDTTLVAILRKLAGRAASQGGRDHSSHRLVALGMSERQAVWVLYGFAVASGLLALWVRKMPLDTSLAAIAGFTLILAFLGIYLAGVRVYSEVELEAARNKRFVGFLFDVSHNRRVFEVLLDVLLIILSYNLSYSFLYGAVSENGAWHSFMLVVPVLVCVKLTVFLALGVYRGLWRYVSVDDLIMYAKAVLLASAASALAVLLLFRFQGFSRVVFMLDAIVLLLMVAGSRLAFRILRSLLPTATSGQQSRVLIYGAGDAGELLLREIRGNRTRNLHPVGFVDDDPLKRNLVIHGLRVYAGNGGLRTVLRQMEVDELIISSSKFSDDRMREIACDCRDTEVALTRMSIHIEQLARPVTSRLTVGGPPQPACDTATGIVNRVEVTSVTTARSREETFPG